MYKNFILIAMKRSGQHGVINWLAQQFKNNTIHYNNCINGWDNKMFLPMKPNCVVYYENSKTKVNNYFFDHKINPVKSKELENELKNTTFENVESTLLNIEDLSLIDYVNHDMDNFKMEGNSKVVIIIRDPFNFTASCLQRKITPPDAGAVDVAINIKDRLKVWVEHAKQITGEKKILNNDPYFINYNEWFSSKKYRKQICEDLGLTFTDKGINSVINYGSGSSFDRENFNGKAQEMSILNRWEKFKDDEEFKSLMTPEIIRLSEEIFNFNPI